MLLKERKKRQEDKGDDVRIYCMTLQKREDTGR
jgi:hypothetical protein